MALWSCGGTLVQHNFIGLLSKRECGLNNFILLKSVLYQLDIESIRLKKCQVELVETGAMSTRLRQAQADSIISMSNWY